MTMLVVSERGEIRLPESVRNRYSLLPDTALRIIETRRGIMLIPLTADPMDESLTQEISEWQSIAKASWDEFPFDPEE